MKNLHIIDFEYENRRLYIKAGLLNVPPFRHKAVSETLSQEFQKESQFCRVHNTWLELRAECENILHAQDILDSLESRISELCALDRPYLVRASTVQSVENTRKFRYAYNIANCSFSANELAEFESFSSEDTVLEHREDEILIFSEILDLLRVERLVSRISNKILDTRVNEDELYL